MGITRAVVVQTASDMADEKGLHGISLKSVAEKLNIRTPSLYNHIENLDDLFRSMAHNGMRTMNKQMSQTAIGKTGDDAIKSVSIEYLNFVIAHPGIYEAIQWATWHGNAETAELFENYTNLLVTLIRSCNLKSPQIDEILNLLTGVLHGYTTLQLRNAFERPDIVRQYLCNVIDTVLLGIHQKYD